MHMLGESGDVTGGGLSAVESADTSAEIHRLAGDLLPDLGAVAAAVLDAVLVAVPDLVPPDSHGAMATALESTEQNIGVMLSTLAFGVAPSGATPPPATIRLLETIVENGGDITVLLSAYRAGHRRLWELWSAHVGASIINPECERDVLARTSAHLFAFIDGACRALLEIYRAEYGEGLSRVPVADQTSAARRELIEALLTSESVDQQRVRTALGYELGAHHLAAVFIPLTGEADVQGVMERVHVRLGSPAWLVHAREDGTRWVWFGSPVPLALDVLDEGAGVCSDDVVIGLGTSGFRLQGFRRSHDHVAEVERMVRMSQAPRAGITRYKDIALAALLCVDEIRAAHFAAERLGTLAEPGEAMARHTLSEFLACGRSKVRAAERLHVHQKTVTYRLARAEELLGHGIDDCACELDAALRIHFALFGS